MLRHRTRQDAMAPALHSRRFRRGLAFLEPLPPFVPCALCPFLHDSQIIHLSHGSQQRGTVHGRLHVFAVHFHAIARPQCITSILTRRVTLGHLPILPPSQTRPHSLATCKTSRPPPTAVAATTIHNVRWTAKSATRLFVRPGLVLTTVQAHGS